MTHQEKVVLLLGLWATLLYGNDLKTVTRHISN